MTPQARIILRIALALLAGIAVAILLARYGWFAISLDESVINRDWSRAFGLPYVLLIPLIVALSVAWPVLASRSLPVGRVAVPLLTALVAAEIVVRTGPFQQALWLAVKARSAGHGDFFLRELAYLKLANIADRDNDPRRIVTIGTSQIIIGLSQEKMQSAFPELSICRRGIAGMVPLRMAAAIDSFPVRSNDVVIMYLSSFDLRGIDRFDPDWLRPIVTPDGLRATLRCLPAADRSRGWRGVVDLTLAAHLELWRCRDAFRTLLMCPAGKPDSPSVASVAAPGPAATGRHEESNRDRDRWWVANLKALEEVVDVLSRRGARIVAFEGQTNPEGPSAGTPSDREDARREFTLLFLNHGGTFVPLSEQPCIFTAADFKDAAHLSIPARDRFTDYVAGWLRTKLSNEWKN